MEDNLVKCSRVPGLNIDIRNEKPDDAARIHEVIELAFRDASHADHNEQFIVKALRDCGTLTVSLVAEVDGKIIGHVALSPVIISDGTAEWYGLGPISVLQEYQGKGIGTKLMNKALTEIEIKGAAGCVVLGEPDYYGRFGFKAVDGLIFPGVPPEYFQALAFRGATPRGEVTYQEAFNA